MTHRLILLLKDTAVDWYEDDAPQKAASLAYYTLLSTAPLVVFSVTIAGIVFGDEAARGQVATQVGTVVGPQAATAIQGVVRNAHQEHGGALSSIIGVAVLLFGASGVFGELQTTMNAIWGVKPKPGRGLKGVLRDRFLSFTMVLGVAFMLLVSLLISAAVSALGEFLSSSLPGGEVVWQLLNLLVSLSIITGLLGLIFKIVPDAEIRWQDVWVGAFATAVLFTVGKSLLGLYLGKSSFSSSYGAAGSVVALVVWVYYASQILFMGAEFTQVYARIFGRTIQPSAGAIPVDEKTVKPAASADRPSAWMA